MDVPNISALAIDDPGTTPTPHIPDDILHASDPYMTKLRNYAQSLPYSIEPYSRMQKMLDTILLRIAQCVEAKDYDPGLLQWDSMLTYWSRLKYPIPKEKRIRLAKVYFHISTTPGMPSHVVATACDALVMLTRSKKKLSLQDMRLPWKPIYNILSKDLFLTRRQFEITQTSWYMGFIAENARRFFHPAAIDEMLSTFLPMFKGTSLNTILASQYYMLIFLPLTHPQSYLPMLFRLWESINSYSYDERMLQFLSRLTEMHVDPTMSDPRRVKEIPDDARSEDEGRPNWPNKDLESKWRWSGLYQDVGIFNEHDWDYIMCKCLASMEIPLADSGSLTTGPSADNQAGFEVSRLPKPTWRIASLARIIVYSMASDGLPSPSSAAPTPAFTPFASRAATPLPQQNGGLADYLSAPLGKGGHFKAKTYLAGCKALDSLVKLIASVEGFFHPTNSGSWTTDLSAFIKYIVYDFNKRWHEEMEPTCKTPLHRRLTKEMKRELVKSLRTVALLAMFSQDSTTVGNIQSCLKSMSTMEPDLILHPILERAGPALESLVETQRTMAMIKALGAIAPAMVCRDIYYPGAKHIIPILDLLLPGIDLNDPPKTFCTTSFIVEIAQYIKFGEMTSAQQSMAENIDGRAQSDLPVLEFNSFPAGVENETELSKEEEDVILKNTSANFADWVAAFLRRVILLFENLPEEGAHGTTGSTTEVQLVDAVLGAFSQICVHLSEPLYDMVLKMVFDYASGNVRSNAVRAIHQLVECVANADPVKTLAKFMPFCEGNIRVELEHGASSLRTTSDSSTPLPSDTTLHWNLAILRGAMYNDGRATLRYREQLISLFQLLHRKTHAKRGYSSTGKLLSSTLLTLTHTYPLENKFVNPDEWESEDFKLNHHLYWGKLYKPEDVKLSWHVPNAEEVDFALQIFRELIEPALTTLDGLLDPGVVRDAVWRNDFCRHLSFVRNAFTGIPTLAKERLTPDEQNAVIASSDILNEIPEMLGTIEPVNSGFALTDPSDPRHLYITSLRGRFGRLLHKASVALRQQGEENTVDAVHLLIRSIRTYMLEYGDSRDNYYLQSDRYESEANVARHYANQKVWPRALHVRRARLYHSARLNWNSIDRRRSQLEDQLIDDTTEWAMWNYVTVRETSQSLLESLCNSYDGIRRRCLPVLYKALDPGTEDSRMKGALWTLNYTAFAKYAVGEPTLTTQMVQKLFRCQHNERPSVQQYVANLADTCLSSFAEPCYVVYEVDNPGLENAAADLKYYLPSDEKSDDIVSRCKAQRIDRLELMNRAVGKTTQAILETAQSSKTHWRYSIVAVRCLRTLIRRDGPTSPEHIQYILEKTHDSNSDMRYYAQRAVMKISRFIKLKTTSHGPVDLVLEQNHNPLRRKVPIQNPSHELTSEWLAQFKIPLDLDRARREPLLCEKIDSGWLVWKDTASCFLAPHPTKPTFAPWNEGSQDAISALRDVAVDPTYWEKLSTHFAAENHADVISQDNVSCVQSIFQVLDDEPFEALKPTVEKLIKNDDKNNQRAAAEFLSGLICGSKHWPTERQNKLWEWFAPHMTEVLGQQSNDNLPIWVSFLEFVFHNKDPRRLQPLVDYIMNEFNTVDLNGESTLDAVQVLCFFRAFYEELGWRFTPWVEGTVARCWSELSRSEHDDVLAYISEIFSFTGKVMWRPTPSVPTAETFVRECRTLSLDHNMMGIRWAYHEGRVLELVDKFQGWRDQRLPGVRAFQSTYDRVGIMVCKWLFQMIHDINAASTFDYILPLMPELFRFTELNDNDDLAHRAKLLLVRMCGVILPRPLINPMLDAIFKAIQSSPSWRVRLKILPLVQVFYFRQAPMISEIKLVELLEVVCRCLDDEVVEVREMAATTLSGILRLSPRRSIVALKNRFVRLAKNSALPDRRSPVYNTALRQRHAAILGICALVESYPYTVEKWLPELLTSVLAEYTYDPIPISTTVRKCASNFKKTHQDTWHEDSKRFSDDQMAALSTLLTGSSYYA